MLWVIGRVILVVILAVCCFKGYVLMLINMRIKLYVMI
jgi:hypothetical protein